jgi:hypothetical protein
VLFAVGKTGIKMNDYKPIDIVTYNSLVAKCQENPFLSHDKDKALDGAQYEFCIASDINALRLYFQSKYWAPHQGIVYKNLAFIQQSEAGDEWWALLKTANAWLEIDTYSFEKLCENEPYFISFINLLQLSASNVSADDERFEEVLETTRKIARLHHARTNS